VIACHCHAVSDRTVRATVLGGATDVEEIGQRCHAGTDCGGCHRMLERLLRDVAPNATAAVAVA
jgi:bacterioferritin-associated ferredoxin